MRTEIIYKLTNKVNGKSYIGKTIEDLKTRLRKHKYWAKKLNSKINVAIRKYGMDNFEVEVLEQYIIGENRRTEEYYIELFNTWHNGYNSSKDGEGIHKNAFRDSRGTTIGGVKLWYVKSPCDDECWVLSLHKICKEFDLNQGKMAELANGTIGYYKGWECERLL